MLAILLAVVALSGLGVQFGLLHSDALLQQRGFQGPSLLDSLPQNARADCFGTTEAAALQPSSVSVVAAICNRSDSLLRVLPSWLAVKGVSEIVLLDWSSEPPLSALELPADPRLRLVRAVSEHEWNLARAYNLGLQLARGEIVLKVDSDTWLDPDVLHTQPLATASSSATVFNGDGNGGGGGRHGFLRGCRDDAPDENARHLNGVLLARRADLLRVRGYDERMQRYGYDDTDLYARLGGHLNLSGGCLSFATMHHAHDGHAERGLTHVHHILHRRAISGGAFPLWHQASTLPPTTWSLVDPSHANATRPRGPLAPSACRLVSVRRPPFFEELLADSDELVQAQHEALMLYSRRALKPSSLATLTDSNELNMLLRVHHGMLTLRQAYLAVRPMHGLANRMRAYCSAHAYAQQTGRRLLLVWEPDVHTWARFDELFERPPGGADASATMASTDATHAASASAAAGAGARVATVTASSVGVARRVGIPPVELLHRYHPSLFPLELWRHYDQMGHERARRRQALPPEDDGRSLFVSSAYKLETSPPVNRSLYAACLRGLRPVAAVKAMLVEEASPPGSGGGVGTGGGSSSRGSAGGSAGGSVTGSAISSGANRSLTGARERRVGVHIRMRVDQSADVPWIASDTRADSSLAMMDEARPYRQACHYSHFLKTMRTWRQADPSTVFYLASDSEEAYEHVVAAFPPGVVRTLPEATHPQCSGNTSGVARSPAAGASTDTSGSVLSIGGRRGLRCQHAALADLINLERFSDRLLLSHWSSWADILIAVAPPDVPRQSGCRALQPLPSPPPPPPPPTTTTTTMRAPAAVVGGGGIDSTRRTRRGGGARSQLPPPSPPPAKLPPMKKSEDLLKAAGRQVAGLSMRKVTNLAALPTRPSDIKVRAHTSREVREKLPKAVRDLRLIFLVPSKVKVRTLAGRMMKMMLLHQPPNLRLRADRERRVGAEPTVPGELLDEASTVSSYYETHHDASDGFLHVFIELRE